MWQTDVSVKHFYLRILDVGWEHLEKESRLQYINIQYQYTVM